LTQNELSVIDPEHALAGEVPPTVFDVSWPPERDVCDTQAMLMGVHIVSRLWSQMAL
jgi:hypothetical protein